MPDPGVRAYLSLWRYLGGGMNSGIFVDLVRYDQGMDKNKVAGIRLKSHCKGFNRTPVLHKFGKKIGKINLLIQHPPSPILEDFFSITQI